MKTALDCEIYIYVCSGKLSPLMARFWRKEHIISFIEDGAHMKSKADVNRDPRLG